MSVANNPTGSKSVQVSNISALLQDTHLRELFEICGAIADMTPITNGACIVSFNETEHAKAAACLSGTPLGDKPLKVVLDQVASGLPAHIVAMQQPLTGAVQQVAHNPQFVPQPSFQPFGQQYVNPVSANPNHNRMHGQQLGRADTTRADEVARTIFCGNLAPDINETHLREFWSAIGTVLYVKCLNDANRHSFYAFIEFASRESAAAAHALTGTILGTRPIRVGPAQNPIIKTATAPSANLMALIPGQAAGLQAGGMDRLLQDKMKESAEKLRLAMSKLSKKHGVAEPVLPPALQAAATQSDNNNKASDRPREFSDNNSAGNPNNFGRSRGGFRQNGQGFGGSSGGGGGGYRDHRDNDHRDSRQRRRQSRSRSRSRHSRSYRDSRDSRDYRGGGGGASRRRSRSRDRRDGGGRGGDRDSRRSRRSRSRGDRRPPPRRSSRDRERSDRPSKREKRRSRSNPRKSRSRSKSQDKAKTDEKPVQDDEPNTTSDKNGAADVKSEPQPTTESSEQPPTETAVNAES